MLGSFFMGLAASASTLKIKDASKAVGVLPLSSPWQANGPLQVGVRTGYCGSLTTFASWELSMVQLLIGGKAGTLTRRSSAGMALARCRLVTRVSCECWPALCSHTRALQGNREQRVLLSPLLQLSCISRLLYVAWQRPF